MSQLDIRSVLRATAHLCWNGDTALIKDILRRGRHAAFIFPSGRNGCLRRSARDLFLGVYATVPEIFLLRDDLNLNDVLGNILLHLAADISDYKLIELLLKQGAEAASLDNNGRTVLHIACMTQSLDIITLLAENSPAYVLDLPDKSGRTPLHFACEYSHPKVVHFLLSQGCSVFAEDEQRSSPLLKAVHNVAQYATPITSLLLDAGANVNHADRFGRTALMYAIGKCPEIMQRAPNSPDQIYTYEDLCMLLIDRGSDVNAVNNLGETALHIAVIEKQENLVRKIIFFGSYVNRRDSFDFTPLHYACLFGSQRLVDLLLTCGANLRGQNWESCLTTFEYFMGGKFKQLQERCVQLLNYVFRATFN